MARHSIDGRSIIYQAGVSYVLVSPPSDADRYIANSGAALLDGDYLLFDDDGVFVFAYRPSTAAIIYQRVGWDMFNHGVASGDPTPTGAVIWTRVNTWQQETNMLVEVSTASDMSAIVYEKLVPSNEFSSSRDYTYSLDLHGLLQPATRYYYRFSYLNNRSTTGTFKTFPLPTASPALLKFAVITCQHYQEGYWQAFDTIAGISGLDFVLHLGDFIYDYVRSDGVAGRTILLPGGVAQDAYTVPASLADYRTLYKTYRTDASLRALMAAVPFIIMADDHEFTNDYYYNEEAATHTGPDHPYNANATQMETLWQAAMRAFSEYTPSRIPAQRHRRLQYGDLLDGWIIDSRFTRSPHPCGEGYTDRVFSEGCAQQTAADQTMLGVEQLRWVTDGLAASTARWQMLGSPELFSELLVPGDVLPRYLKLDGFDGYPNDRDAILAAAAAAGSHLLVISGDLHANIVSRIYAPGTNTLLGAEYMTPALSSNTLGTELLDTLGYFTEANHEGIILANNATGDTRIISAEAYKHGFIIISVAQANVQCDLYTNDATDSGSVATLTNSWVTNRTTLNTVETYP